jgi:hypothetical protein
MSEDDQEEYVIVDDIDRSMTGMEEAQRQEMAAKAPAAAARDLVDSLHSEPDELIRIRVVFEAMPLLAV